MTIINDSTIAVHNSQIKLSEILKIKVQLNTKGKGAALLFLTGATAGLSAYSIYLFSQSSTIFELFSYGALSIASGGLAVGLLLPSIMLLSNGVYKYYNSDKWTYTIQDSN